MSSNSASVNTLVRISKSANGKYSAEIVKNGVIPAAQVPQVEEKVEQALNASASNSSKSKGLVEVPEPSVSQAELNGGRRGTKRRGHKRRGGSYKKRNARSRRSGCSHRNKRNTRR